MLISLFLVLQGLVVSEAPKAALSEPVADECQIFWQRSLDDALALSRQEQRPILIAVNTDAESASERIVRERYRAPKFVDLTRRFVCLAATVFRHAGRDHTYDGRRIDSPRLGEITSGEAMSLEPILFGRYLGGEGIAPRHALILPDGSKSFDLFLLFDLGELDSALARARDASAPALARDETPLVGSRLSHAEWLQLASARDNRQRARFESLLLPPAPIAQVEQALRALLERGDVGACEALRIAFARCGEAPLRLAPLATLVARARGIDAATAALLREMLTDVPEALGPAGLGERAELLDALAELGGELPANRSLLMSYAVAGSAHDESPRALRWLQAAGGVELVRRIENVGQSIDTERVLHVAQRITRDAPWRAPDDLQPAEQVEAELVAADEQYAGSPGDLAAQLRFGKAALNAARTRIASGGSSIQLLLSDAQIALDKFPWAKPDDIEAWLLLARTNYLLGDFEAEEQAALGALAALPQLDPQAVARLLGSAQASDEQLTLDARAVAQPHERLEALRWLADACARLLEARSGRDLAVEAEGMARGYRAAALAALSSVATPTDWLTYSALHAALGRRRDEIAIARQGLDFFPEAQELRTAYYLAVWERGYPLQARLESERIAQDNPRSGVSRWYVGYAGMQEGNSLRRAEDPRAAIAAYRRADESFQACVALSPEYQASADYYRALAALGRGFAHLLIDERKLAAAALVEGIALHPAIADVRDPLDREAVDLLDGILEWRASGPSPVDPLSLAADFERAEPGNPAWSRRISDSELREGLRADGRGDMASGDAFLEHSIQVARLAAAGSSSLDDVRALAQALTVQAERLMARARFQEALPLLTDAAGLLGEVACPSGASDGEMTELAARLRAKLGEARPLVRPGR